MPLIPWFTRSRQVPLYRLDGTYAPQPSAATPLPSDINGLLTAAYQDYLSSLSPRCRSSITTLTAEIEGCTAAQEVSDILQEKAKLVKGSRRGNGRAHSVRGAIKPIVCGLGVILETAAETSSALQVPGGKGISAAISVFLKNVFRLSTYNVLAGIRFRLRRDPVDYGLPVSA
ncbi:unnamed protein product [Peniophora sp. CBMAI 1063]|nr:unnamed protein product [Peniophora sp. CBMAI 1063]